MEEFCDWFFFLIFTQHRQVPEQLQVPVYRINMNDYEYYHYDKDHLAETGKYFIYSIKFGIYLCNDIY